MAGFLASGIGFWNSTVAWSPAMMFAAGEQGIWLDPSDLSTMFQDASGTIPVTAGGQQVGLILDKSKGLALGAELRGGGEITISGTPPAGSVYNPSSGEGAVRRTDYTNQAYLTLTAEAGWYKVSVTNHGPHAINLRTANGVTAFATLLAGRTFDGYVNHTGGWLSVHTGDGQNASFTVHSVKAIAGNHAFATGSLRPTLMSDGGRYYLNFAGAQCLQTNAINFTGTDEMTMCAGLSKASNAAAALVTELSVNSSGTNGSFALFAPSTAAANFAARSVGTTASFLDYGNTYPAGTPYVVTAQADISADSLVGRVNGVQRATLATDQGSGTYGNHALYIGARAGSSLFYTGGLYGLVVRGRLTSGPLGTAMETWMNAKTGAF